MNLHTVIGVISILLLIAVASAIWCSALDKEMKTGYKFGYEVGLIDGKYKEREKIFDVAREMIDSIETNEGGDAVLEYMERLLNKLQEEDDK